MVSTQIILAEENCDRDSAEAVARLPKDRQLMHRGELYN